MFFIKKIYILAKKIKNMSKIFNFYAENVDYTWYQSSNVKYSECIDYDNALKTLRITFNNGSTYQYDNVNVNDYLLFRENASQGKAFQMYIKQKGYAYSKINGRNIAELDDELHFRLSDGVYLEEVDGNHVMKNSKESIICQFGKELTDNEIKIVTQVSEALGHKIEIKKK